MTASPVYTGRWTCSSCGRTVEVTATDLDVACCLDAVRDRHAEGHATATSPRVAARARRAASRAAARRRAKEQP
ncbi:hypothetical protein [Blastococcus sp. CT_GayMR16]|uniref:hypothetical protein n=1 Tax=Blastococcus sp. CT_GayMR16 TaxID=2559607 RepID=UPI0010743859|nr:hypothetical protein [Blastococcus sp. CT_GayMR16]TFV90411.1 hypothetical protein E4P38_02935 [Blastococcus sp. CT_GayMR16]